MEINLCRVGGEFFPAVAGRLTEGPGEYSAFQAPWSGLQSTLIRHENGACQNYSSNWRNLKKTSEFPDRVLLKHKFKMTDDCCVLKSSSVGKMLSKPVFFVCRVTHVEH